MAVGLATGSLVGPGGTFAHDGSTTSLEVPVERVPPGSSMPLVGLDFFPGERLSVVLNGADGSSVILGSVQAGADGHFETFLDLPVDLVTGVVGIDAISDSGIIVRAFVTIDPTAPAASYDPVFPTLAEQQPAPDVDLVPVAALGLAIAGLAVLSLRTRRSSAAR